MTRVKMGLCQRLSALVKAGVLVFVATGLALVTLPSSTAHAAQDTTVIVDNTPIRLEPDTSAQVLEYLPLGSEVRISSYPLPGGWYRVRSKTGDYGWIQEDALSARKGKPGEDGKLEPPKPERDRLWHLRLFYGFDFFRPSDLNDVFAFKELDTGMTLGGELGRFVTRHIALLLRSETLSKNVIARERTTSTVYNLTIHSYPIMAGVDFYFANFAAFKFSMGLFGGLALGTSFSSQATNLAAPNEFILQSNPFTTLIRANVTRPMGRIFSVFGEVGYRFLKTDQLSTASAIRTNGGVIFGKDGTYNPRVIDLSGVEAALGIGLHF